MFKKAKKHLLSSFMLCGMTAFSMQAHSDEVCFVNMTNVPIEAGWVLGPSESFIGDHIVMTPQRNAACTNIAERQTIWGIYRVLGANGQPVSQGGWLGWLNGNTILENFALKVFDPVIGRLDFNLGYSQPVFFSSVQLGNFNGENVMLSDVEKGSDGVYRVFFRNY